MQPDDPTDGTKYVEEVELDPAAPIEAQKDMVKAESENAKGGRLVGLLILALGVLLAVVGVTGVTDLSAEGSGMKVVLKNAAPGALLMLIGLAVIWRTNLSIKHKK